MKVAQDFAAIPINAVLPCWEKGINHMLTYLTNKHEEYGHILTKIQRCTTPRKLIKRVNLLLARMAMIYDISCSLSNGKLQKKYLLDMHHKFATTTITFLDRDSLCARSLCSREGIWLLIKSGELVL